MSGAQVHLEAGGTFIQDPQKTLFSLNYKPRDVYVAETFEVPIDRSKPEFGGTVSATIPPKSDIVRRLTLRSELPQLYTPLGPGYVYPLYTDQVDGSVYVNTNTLAIQPGDFVGYFNTQFLNQWATNFVGYANISVAYDSTTQKFVFTSPTYSNIVFQNEQSASFWGFDIRSPDFLTTVGSYPGYNFSGGTLTSPLTLIQAGWIRGFTPPPTTGFSYVDSVGTKLIKSIELKIGGQTIDRLTSERLYLEDDLGVAYENQAGLTILEGKNDTSIVSAPREYYTRLNFDMDVLNMAQLYRQDVRLDVEYEKFENLPSNVITTNSLTDGASYVNTQWKTLNGIPVIPPEYYECKTYSMNFWQNYIIFPIGTGSNFTFWFYDTTKPVGLASSWTSWISDVPNSSIPGHLLTVGSNVYYSFNTTLSRVSIPDMLAGTATTVVGTPYLENKYVSLAKQIGTAGGNNGICADARYIYISYVANMISFGSNSAAIYFFSDSPSANLSATFNVYSIATTQLIASDNTAVLTYMDTWSFSPPPGVTKNPATIVSQTKIGSNVIVVSNVAYTYTSNGEPASITFDEDTFKLTTMIWLRYDTTQSISSLSSYDYLSWPGTGAPRSWRDITGQHGFSDQIFYPSTDGRYIYTSNPYFFKTDTQNFLSLTSYTYVDVAILSPTPSLPGFFLIPNASDGRYMYFMANVTSGSVTLIRYDSTQDISLQSSYSSITYTGFGSILPSEYRFGPIGFDGKSIYYLGESRYKLVSGTYYYDIARTIMRVDSTTFTVTDWIVFDGYGNAQTSNGPVTNTISFTSIASDFLPATGNPAFAVGSRYIYIGEVDDTNVSTTDFIQFDPLTMSNTLSSSILVKYEKYVDQPKPTKALYGQSDVEEFIMRTGRDRDTFQLRFLGPVSEFWVAIDTPGVISRLILRLNNEILIDDDQVTTRYIRPFETHTTMPTSNVCTYSLALDPEKLASSGSLNMSRIAYPTLEVFLVSPVPSDTKLRVHARSFNLLEYKGGVGGLLFNSAL